MYTHKIVRVASDWHCGSPLSVTNPGPVFKPWSPIQWALCASWMVCLSRFKPRAVWSTNDLFWNLLFIVVACQISSHLTMGIAVAFCLLQRLDGGEQGLGRKPMTPSVNSHGRPQIERPTMSLKWRLSSALSNLGPDSMVPTGAKQKLSY